LVSKPGPDFVGAFYQPEVEAREMTEGFRSGTPWVGTHDVSALTSGTIGGDIGSSLAVVAQRAFHEALGVSPVAIVTLGAVETFRSTGVVHVRS